MPYPASPDGGIGWVVLLGINIINLSVYPISQCFGIIFEEKFTNLGINATQTSLILHLNSFMMCILWFLGAPIFRKYNFQQVSIAGAFFVSIAICLTSFANSFSGFIFTYCILLGCGQGILFPATNLALNTYFNKKRSIAMGITVTVTGLGPTVTPYICNKLLLLYGVNGTVLLLGAVSLHAFIGTLLIFPFNKSSDNKNINNETMDHAEEEKLLQQATPVGPEILLDARIISERHLKLKNETPMFFRSDSNIPGTVKHIATVPFKSEANLTRENIHVHFINDLANYIPKNSITTEEQEDHEDGILKSILHTITTSLNLELLQDAVFVSIVIGMSVSFVAELNFVLMTPFVLIELADFQRKDIAYVLSIQALVDIIARFSVPLLAVKYGWNARVLYVISLTCSIFGRTVLTIFYNDYIVILGTAGLLGFAKGIKAVFQAIIIPNYVPLEKLPAATGLLYISNAILSLILGPVIGFIHDMTNSYVAALNFTSSLSLFCIILWILEYFYYKMKNRNSDS